MILILQSLLILNISYCTCEIKQSQDVRKLYIYSELINSYATVNEKTIFNGRCKTFTDGMRRSVVAKSGKLFSPTLLILTSKLIPYHSGFT